MEVGERADLEEFTPTGFANISGNELRSAEAAPKPRFPAGGGTDSKPVERGNKKTEAGKQKQRRAGVPKPGSVPRYRSSCRAGRKDNTVEFFVIIDEELAESSEVGIRLRLASGSDGTCEQPLPDTWLSLCEVSVGKYSQSSASDDGDLELALPLGSGKQYLNVVTSKPIDQLALLELDLVRRKPSVKESVSVKQPDSVDEESESVHIQHQQGTEE